jgi:tetratricopeptide (TPR) repeat protein
MMNRDYYVSKMEELHLMEKYDELFLTAKIFLKRFPDESCSYYFLGHSLLGKEKAKKAIPYFQKAYNRDPKNPEYNIGLALAFLASNDQSKAEAYMEDGLNYAIINPATELQVFLKIASLLNDIGFYYMALESLVEFLERGGDVFCASLAMGSVSENMANEGMISFQYALLCYDRAAQLRKGNYLANVGRFICGYHTNDSIQTTLSMSVLNNSEATELDWAMECLFPVHNKCDLRLSLLEPVLNKAA